MRRSLHATRLAVEILEDRCVPAYNVLSVSGDALNNLGQIIGNGAFYDNGVPIDLNLRGTTTARALNDLGQVAGSVRATSIDRAFMWDPSLGMTDLGISDTSVANGINDAGQVTGTIGYEYVGSASRAFLWDSAGGLRDLGALGGTSAVARDINNSGQVVGWREVHASMGTLNSFNHLAYIYNANSGDVAFLGTLGTQSSRALDINDTGQVVGISGGFGGPSGSMWFAQKTFLWQNGVMTDLGITPAHFGGTLAINNLGQVVSGRYLWQNGVVTDVNALVSLPAGWTVTSVTDINDAGMMIGWANFTVGTTVYPQPVLLVPDTIPTFGISDARVTELDAETATAVFTVTRTGPLDQSVTVDYTTLDGMVEQYRAIAGQDYVAASGSLTFNPDEASKTINVTILGDTAAESSNFFHVRLSPAPGGTLADLQGQGVILDNDVLPALTINDVVVTEGQSGLSTVQFTLNLSSSGKPVTVNFATANGSATDTDYTAASGIVTFAADETTKTISVLVKGDTLPEGDETFFVNLSGVTNATLADAQGQATIVNDDVAPTLSISDVAIVEDNSGSRYAVFTVTLSVASDKAISVNFASADGTAKKSDNDYAAKSGKLSFSAGQTTKTISIQIKGDKKIEANETFVVNLSGAVGAAILDGQGLGTILNDD